MRRFAFIFIGIILLAGSLRAQAPAGWQVRIDRSTSATDPDDVPDIKVATVGKGFRVTGGPAGTFWNPTNSAKGNFTARGTFTLMKPSGHVNYYGLVFGGEELGTAQAAVHLLPGCAGRHLYHPAAHGRERAGRPPRDALRRAAAPAPTGSSTNALEVRVAGGQISYVVNGTVVHTTPKSGLTAQTDGIVGVRINHVLDVQVDAFQVQQQ